MYIEDIIMKLTGSVYSFSSYNSFYRVAQSGEFKILINMSEQLSMGNALTEKQGMLALRILDSYVNTFKTIVPELEESLAAPKWKQEFRTLAVTKEIKIEERDSEISGKKARFISLSFPFDKQLVDKLQKRNQEVHELHKGTWDARNKVWTFFLTEKNIMFIGQQLLTAGFSGDEEFMGYYDSLTELCDNLEQHVPILSMDGDTFVIKNGHSSIPHLETNSVIEAAFFAKRYGIQIWDDEVSSKISDEANPVTKKILSATGKNRLWFDSDEIAIGNFNDLVNYGGKVLIIVPGGSELPSLKAWTEFAFRNGISNEDLSVMFRLPNEHSKFNEYVKDNKINNPVTDNTKMVFVSTKITKPLVKSGIRFDTVINLGYYNYMHFSMSTIVDGVCNMLFYSMKAPTEQSKWQQREL